MWPLLLTSGLWKEGRNDGCHNPAWPIKTFQSDPIPHLPFFFFFFFFADYNTGDPADDLESLSPAQPPLGDGSGNAKM